MVCLTNDTGIFTQWFFNNEILLPSETRLISTDNRTLTLQPVSSADAGDYQCEISNSVSSSKSGHVRLQVTRRWPSWCTSWMGADEERDPTLAWEP